MRIQIRVHLILLSCAYWEMIVFVWIFKKVVKLMFILEMISYLSCTQIVNAVVLREMRL